MDRRREVSRRRAARDQGRPAWTDGLDAAQPEPSRGHRSRRRRHGARGRHATEKRRPPSFDPSRSLPILIHGDAAFPGQGVVAETLNLCRAPAIGPAARSTSSPTTSSVSRPTPGSYSTSYASGLARGFKIPIVHVNADDPEACIEAARLAFAYRATFQRDFLIDLIGYRRHGHNEGDEPAFTQPFMYQRIAPSDRPRNLGTDARRALPRRPPTHPLARSWPSCRGVQTR